MRGETRMLLDDVRDEIAEGRTRSQGPGNILTTDDLAERGEQADANAHCITSDRLGR